MRVPFPFVEQDRQRTRPALVVSRPVGPSGTLLWTLMITTAQRGTWPGDVPLDSDHAQYGLPVPCVIRTAKIAAFEAATVKGLLGRLPATIKARVDREMAIALGGR